MSEKNLYVSQLYDWYGALLSEKQKFAVEAYYNDDLSLSEIAESIGITRQGVRDQLKHAEQFLENCEEKLGFASKMQEIRDRSDSIVTLCAACPAEKSADGGSEVLREIRKHASAISDLAN